MCDDLFDDLKNGDELLERSWKKNIDDINKEGYRDGVDAGREESVQEGFNEAFSLASKLLFQLAKLRGTISGQLSMNFLKPGTFEKETEAQLQDLLQDVCLYESELLTFSKSRFSDLKTESSKAQTKTVNFGENDEKLQGPQEDLTDSSEKTQQECTTNSKNEDRAISSEHDKDSDLLGEMLERQGACDMTGKKESGSGDNSTANDNAAKPCSDDKAVLTVTEKSKFTELTEKYKLILDGPKLI